jgi:hypothetical protein
MGADTLSMMHTVPRPDGLRSASPKSFRSFLIIKTVKTPRRIQTVISMFKEIVHIYIYVHYLVTALFAWWKNKRSLALPGASAQGKCTIVYYYSNNEFFPVKLKRR